MTGIPRSTVTRIINKLEKLGAIRRTVIRVTGMGRRSGYKHEVDPQFLHFLSKHVEDVQSEKPRGFPPVHPQGGWEQSDEKPSQTGKRVKRRVSTRPEDPEKLEEWCKNGWFRIHGFQRKWSLKGFRLVDDEEKWERFALLLNRSKVPAGVVRRVRIGRKKKGISYIVKVYSEAFRSNFLLHFRPNCLIVTPDEGGIVVAWDDWHDDIERDLLTVMGEIVSRAMEVYKEIFGQQVLARDEGWVGRKRQLKPEVGFVDPDGIVHKVYRVEGATQIEGLGYWVDASLRPTPEIEFEDAKEVSKFKKAIEVLASGELDERLESMDRKVEEVKRDIENKVEEAVVKGVEAAMGKLAEKLVESSFAGVVPVQQQLTEIWKRIAELQETLQLVVAVTLLRDEKELVEPLKKRLMEKLKLR